MALLLKEQQPEIEPPPIGSFVYVTCYGPYWGLRGIICRVDVITLADAQALYFYLVALQEGQTKEPLWFVHDDVAVVEGDNASPWHPDRKEQPQREQDRGLKTLSTV